MLSYSLGVAIADKSFTLSRAKSMFNQQEIITRTFKAGQLIGSL